MPLQLCKDLMNSFYWVIIERFKVIIKNEVNEFLVKFIHNRVKKYKHRKTIGKGTFGKVKKGRHILSGEPVAIKVLEKGKIKDITDVQRVARELHILKLVRHSAIAQLYEVIESQDRIFIVMEYAQNGEFFDYIMDGRVYRCGYSGGVNRRRTITSRKLFPDWRIAHRDIKPENMLLDVQNRLKIVDFGLSNMYKNGEHLLTACGSPCYASPQMIRGEPYDPQLTDVWSLGIVLFTILLAKLPFQDDNTSVLYSKIKSGMYIIDKKVSPQYKDLLGKLINVKPDNRLRVAQIKQHPWFTSFMKVNSYGIDVGFQNIPIDQGVVNQLQKMGYDIQRTRRYLQHNVKNDCTAVYYLLLKRNFKLGNGSSADICSQSFDSQLVRRKSKRTKHRSIDFNALIQRNEPTKQSSDGNTKFNDRKCRSQLKDIRIDTSLPTDASIKVHFRRLNRNPTSTTSGKLDIASLLQKRSCSRGQRKTDQNDYKHAVNRHVKENRRLQTEHVRDAYNFRQGRGSLQQRKETEVSDVFWKKKQTSKGNTRYPGQNQKPSKSSKKYLRYVPN